MTAEDLKQKLKQSQVLNQVAWLTGKTLPDVQALVEQTNPADPLTLTVERAQSPASLAGHFVLHSLTLTATLTESDEPGMELVALIYAGNEPQDGDHLRPLTLDWSVDRPTFLRLNWQAEPHTQPLLLANAGHAGQAERVGHDFTQINNSLTLPHFTPLDNKNLVVESLSWEINEQQVVFTALTVRLPDWPISDEFTIAEPRLTVYQNWSPTATFTPILTIAGTIVLHQRTRVNLSLGLPEITFQGELDTDQGPVSMAQLLGDLGAEFDIWPDDVFISRLFLLYAPKGDPTKEFALAFAGDWAILPGIHLETIGVDLKTPSAGGVDVTLNASWRLFAGTDDEFGLDLLAEFQKDDSSRSLMFVAATAPEQTIHLGALVAELLTEMRLELPLPDFLHNLAVGDLNVELSVNQQNSQDENGAPVSQTSRSLAVRFTLESSEGDWELIPGLLSFSPAQIGLTVAGGVVEATVQETIAVLGVTWLIEVHLPTLRGRMALAGDGYHIKDLLDHFHLPVGGLEKATLAAASMTFDAPAHTTMLHLELADPWDMGNFHIQDVAFDLTYQGGQDGGVSAQFAAACLITRTSDPQNPLQLQISADHPGPNLGWKLQGRLWVDPAHAVTIQEVAAHFGFSATDLAPLGEIADCGLFSLGLQYDTHDSQFALECSARLGSNATLALSLDRHRQPDQSSAIRFSGKLLVHDLEFDLLFAHDGHGDALVGVFSNTGGSAIKVGDLLAAVSDDQEIASAVNALNFKLKSALIAYARSNIKASQPGADQGQKNGSKLLFSLDMDAGLDLSGLGNLPLVGQAFHGGETLAIQFSPIIATQEFTDTTSITALLPPNAGRLPTAPIKKGFQLHTTVQIGSERLQLALDGPGQQVHNDPASGVAVPNAAAAALTPPKPPANVTWIPIQKTLAKILTLRRVGIGFASPKLAILLDGGISLGGLTLDLMGLGAEYNFKDKSLAFALAGIGLSLNRDPLIITAAFLNLDGDFVGKAQIVTAKFGLSAMGGFTTKLGPPSLFIYGLLDYPLGGPVFFFVEGLAAGFGFNRHLALPDVSQVDKFPFVADAVGAAQGVQPPGMGALSSNPTDGIGAQLTRLAQYVSPALGEYFLAVGVKFNSFRVLDAFALLVLRLNTNSMHFFIDLLGVATLKVPSESPEILAFIRLNIRASIDPQAGVILIQAQLTPESWLIAPECHLQGGVAYGLWLLGENAGDFVYCVGGYHPHFRLPAHYPRVPRLGFSWSISDAVSIKGDLYYALTPIAAMAGGHLSANWHSGDLKAWFNLGIDLLIQWKPFHYEASAYIEIGASYESPFGTISGSLGADVNIWGPDFSGQAHFHFGPFGFSVEFGSGGHSAPQPLDWPEFKRSFLPADNSKLLSLTVTNGLLRTLEVKDGPKQGTWWLVNPKLFSLDASTVLPVTKYVVAADEPHLPPTQKPVLAPELTALGLAPMNKRQKDFPVSTLTVTVKRDGTQPAAAEFTFTTQAKQFPAALWGQGFQSAGGERLVSGAGGLTITPHEPVAPGTTSFITRRNLNYDDYTLFATRDAAAGQTYAPFPPRDNTQRQRDRATLRANLQDPTIIAARQSALAALGLDAARTVHLTPATADDFIVEPRLWGGLVD
ncbi:MAG: hypothetical protein KA314_09410 [Chloroflexi bacterium]|nr:hypothetical protein [Chloroflexota bacterium]MBP8056048.1 hypothetical protein [Chloroflexota bacterium]